ncbi:MAG: SLBB domain-containing protein [Deltaproteobacteria bacterium]|nr:SLBB domain-containing protein [Deltaproteobacteria bacterium]
MSDAIAQLVREAGIVGAGGAGFPTHVKFGAKADTVIANGAECEPLLRCDKAVLQDRAEAVLQGLTVLADATAAKRLVLALKGHHRDLVRHVRGVAGRVAPAVEIFELHNYYPAGDEQQLVHDVTGRVVPEGGIPLQVGAVVSNVVTLTQVTDAVRHRRPVTRRPLTVAGAVRHTVTRELPIGAPMRLAVELAGGATVPAWRIIEGGPMMGRAVTDPDEPISKRTSGVLVLPADHPLILRGTAPPAREVRLGRVVCCQCRMCTDLCPRYNLGHALEPHLVMRALGTEAIGSLAPTAHVTAAYLCCLCGVCEVYACPLMLSPRKVYVQFRQELAKAGQANPHRRTDCQPHDFRNHRRVPLPRLVARLGLTEYLDVPHTVDWTEPEVAGVCLRLDQHTGAPARPVVAVGQRVRVGDLVGEIPEGKLGARYHASIDGVVTAVGAASVEIASAP